MKITALLPMKGHSKRVPNKNMRLFAGKPLYHCIAQALQDSPVIESILINTDSEIIAEDATKHFSKIKIIERPEKLHGDMVPMNDIIAHDLSVCEGEHFLQTHSTNPLLKITTLKKAVSEYFNVLDRYDSLFSVTKIQTRLYWETGEPVNHNPKELLRTQDLPPLFEENSNFFIFSKSSFYAADNKRIGRKPMMFPMDKLEAIDIDEEEDFILAETLIKMRR
jgi:CMP-N-acetylneuraminic acid synthetase